MLNKIADRMAEHLQALAVAETWENGKPRAQSALDVINAVDGPVVITSCVTNHGNCDMSSTCTVREPLRRVNESIAQVLRSVTISQMAEDSPDAELVGLSI